MELKIYKILLSIVPTLTLILGVIIGVSNAKVTVPEKKKIEKPPVEVIEISIPPEVKETAAEIETEPEYISLGEFELTAYCPCKYCSGGYGKTTACGTTAEEGRTIAVDPSVIPYGSIIRINGNDYIAEDCGGAVKGNIIDIYFENHKTASDFGRQTAEVFIKQ